MIEPKGYCTYCKKDSDSPHKCRDCGKYVFVPVGMGGGIRKVLSEKLAELRAEFEPRIKAAKKALKHEDSDVLQRELEKIRAERRAAYRKFCAPGKQ